jgi:hypothetical protein
MLIYSVIMLGLGCFVDHCCNALKIQPLTHGGTPSCSIRSKVFAMRFGAGRVRSETREVGAL